ncbi:MAG: TetR/AcrR family transcriptional regulator [Ilumatobacteraceae bacterium]
MDGRGLRGERTRKAVAVGAAAIASVDGLSGMTLGQLGESLGLSKSSVQAAYGTKEEVQLAAVASATAIFVSAVVAPAQQAAPGLARLLALVDAWLAYVERRVFPGGCFMVATLAEFDSRPGPVRDALARARRGWLSTLERQAATAQTAGVIPATPAAEMVAFEIDALLAAANVSRNLSDDTAPLVAVRALIALRLGIAERDDGPDQIDRSGRPVRPILES